MARSPNSATLAQVKGIDSPAGFIVSELSIGAAGSPRLYDQALGSLPSYFDVGPPDIHLEDLIDAPICGGKLVESGDGGCPIETTALGFNPLRWELIEQDATTIRLRTDHLPEDSG